MSSWIVVALAACAVLTPARAQVAVPIQTVDEAIDRLPPIGTEGTYDAKRGSWSFEPAVAWLQAHIERGGTLTDEQWRRALLRSGAIRFRERWPVDVPFAISLELPMWLPWLDIGACTDEESGLGAWAGRTQRCGLLRDARLLRERYQTLESEPFSLGARVVSLHVFVERSGRKSWLDPMPRSILWQGKLDLPVLVLPRLEDVLPGVHDPELDAAVRGALRVSLVGERQLRVLGSTDGIPELAATALSLELELREGSVVHATDSLLISERPGSYPQRVDWNLPEDLPDPSQWTVHVRGRGVDAIRVWNAERYWDGEFVIPMTEVEKY